MELRLPHQVHTAVTARWRARTQPVHARSEALDELQARKAARSSKPSHC